MKFYGSQNLHILLYLSFSITKLLFFNTSVVVVTFLPLLDGPISSLKAFPKRVYILFFFLFFLFSTSYPIWSPSPSPFFFFFSFFFLPPYLAFPFFGFLQREAPLPKNSLPCFKHHVLMLKTWEHECVGDPMSPTF